MFILIQRGLFLPIDIQDAIEDGVHKTSQDPSFGRSFIVWMMFPICIEMYYLFNL